MTHQTTAATYWRGARDFYIAASHLLNYPSDTPLPMLFLMARSIELSLKSLLCASGKTAAELAKKPFRHNLTNLLKHAIDCHLVNGVLSINHEASIHLLSQEYDSTGLGYIEEGRIYMLPRFDLIDESAANLLGMANYS